ncbi:unnamed protein product, partial [Protopolystoma xenopodis]
MSSEPGVCPIPLFACPRGLLEVNLPELVLLNQTSELLLTPPLQSSVSPSSALASSSSASNSPTSLLFSSRSVHQLFFDTGLAISLADWSNALHRLPVKAQLGVHRSPISQQLPSSSNLWPGSTFNSASKFDEIMESDILGSTRIASPALLNPSLKTYRLPNINKSRIQVPGSVGEPVRLPWRITSAGLQCIFKKSTNHKPAWLCQMAGLTATLAATPKFSCSLDNKIS